MPNTKQAKKRVRTNETRLERNNARRSRLRHVVRDLRIAMAKADAPSEELSAQLQTVTRMLDRMTSKGILHRNQSARLKSRLSGQMPG